jgi:hypothetical protein
VNIVELFHHQQDFLATVEAILFTSSHKQVAV